MLNQFRIGDRWIGDGHPTYVIAEIGSNHNHSWDMATQLIDAAASAGVDAVKFQTFKASEHVSSKARTPSYLGTEQSLQEIIRGLELDREWHGPLMKFCAEKGIAFFSSPCDYAAVDSLEDEGVPAHKIASFDLPDLDLVGYIAKMGKPFILSTGLADWMEIQRAVDSCRRAGNEQIVLLQCTSLYPAPVELSNLHAIQKMRSTYDVLTGYSDHTMGDVVACASVACGACMIEKHITLDRSLPGPDHPFAIEPQELQSMVSRIRETERAMGDGMKTGPRPAEAEMARLVKRSLHATREIKSGESISSDMLVAKRPGEGIPPYQKQQLLGRIARVDIEADQWITWDML